MHDDEPKNNYKNTTKRLLFSILQRNLSKIYYIDGFIL